MKDLGSTKIIAIARLKANEKIEDIANELDISVSLVQEWAEALTPAQLEGREVNHLTIAKATNLINTSTSSQEHLQSSLINVATALLGEIALASTDPELAKGLNLCADSIAKLQTAFNGNNGTQVAVFNNTNESGQLSKFRGMLKD